MTGSNTKKGEILSCKYPERFVKRKLATSEFGFPLGGKEKSRWGLWAMLLLHHSSTKRLLFGNDIAQVKRLVAPFSIIVVRCLSLVVVGRMFVFFVMLFCSLAKGRLASAYCCALKVLCCVITV